MKKLVGWHLQDENSKKCANYLLILNCIEFTKCLKLLGFFFDKLETMPLPVPSAYSAKMPVLQLRCFLLCFCLVVFTFDQKELHRLKLYCGDTVHILKENGGKFS